MRILSHRTENYRNLKNISLVPDEGINIIFGENGQGKTNIIESLWLLTGCNSFRTYKLYEIIATGMGKAGLFSDFYSGNMEQNAELRMTNKREAVLNGVLQKTPRVLMGVYKAVVFSPSSLSVIQDGPGERRRFLDIAISLIKPAYAVELSKYLKTLTQRNALLRSINADNAENELLDAWDIELAKTGSVIMKYRQEYCKRLSEVSENVYMDIAQNKEKMTLKYLKNGSEKYSEVTNAEKFCDQLKKYRRFDIKSQSTNFGPHRDDILVLLDGTNARAFGSQGQQRTCALSMKIGEANIIRDYTGENPIVLLDDVFSELDTGRQKYLLKHFNEWQVFITCCEMSKNLSENANKIFKIHDGSIC